jgi:hypothetical protein
MTNQEYIELVVQEIAELALMRAIGHDQGNHTPGTERSIEFHLGEAIKSLKRLERELDEEWNHEKPAAPKTGGVKVTISLPENWEERENLPGFATGEGRD